MKYLSSEKLYAIDKQISSLKMGYFDLMEIENQFFIYFEEVKRWHFLKIFKIKRAFEILKAYHLIDIKIKFK